MPGWPGMYTAMRAAIAAGMSAYRVAQLTGMTQRAVHRIRDREIGAAALPRAHDPRPAVTSRSPAQLNAASPRFATA